MPHPIAVTDTNSIEYVLEQATEELYHDERTYWKAVEEHRLMLVRQFVHSIDDYLESRGVVVPPPAAAAAADQNTPSTGVAGSSSKGPHSHSGVDSSLNVSNRPLRPSSTVSDGTMLSSVGAVPYYVRSMRGVPFYVPLPRSHPSSPTMDAKAPAAGSGGAAADALAGSGIWQSSHKRRSLGSANNVSIDAPEAEPAGDAAAVPASAQYPVVRALHYTPPAVLTPPTQPAAAGGEDSSSNHSSAGSAGTGQAAINWPNGSVFGQAVASPNASSSSPLGPTHNNLPPSSSNGSPAEPPPQPPTQWQHRRISSDGGAAPLPSGVGRTPDKAGERSHRGSSSPAEAADTRAHVPNSTDASNTNTRNNNLNGSSITGPQGGTQRISQINSAVTYMARVNHVLQRLGVIPVSSSSTSPPTQVPSPPPPLATGVAAPLHRRFARSAPTQRVSAAVPPCLGGESENPTIPGSAMADPTGAGANVSVSASLPPRRSGSPAPPSAEVALQLQKKMDLIQHARRLFTSSGSGEEAT